ncbi:hypothetical protein S83_049997 [Arachis hypogaea]
MGSCSGVVEGTCQWNVRSRDDWVQRSGVGLQEQADLWSVGAILYQLITGKPLFDGNSQLQILQNILTSTEPQFPQEAFIGFGICLRMKIVILYSAALSVVFSKYIIILDVQILQYNAKLYLESFAVE